MSLALAHAAGFDGIELVLGPEALWRGATSVQRLAAKYGLRIYSVHAPILRMPGWSELSAGIGRLAAYAAAMDGEPPLVVLHVPKARQVYRELAGRRWLETLRLNRDRFASRGVQIAIETPGLFHASEREFELFHVEAICAFAEREGLPIVLDTSHIGSIPYDLLEAYQLTRSRLVNVHLSDLSPVPRWLDFAQLHSYLKHHQLPGRGRLPLQQFVRLLVKDSYSGLLTMELSPVALHLWSPRCVERLLRESIAFVTRIEQGVTAEQKRDLARAAILA